jgi:hypothetical protein
VDQLVGDVVMRNVEFDFVKIFSDGNKIFRGIKWRE